VARVFSASVAILALVSGCESDFQPIARDAAVSDFAVPDFAVATPPDFAAGDLATNDLALVPGVWTELNVGPLPGIGAIWGQSKDDFFVVGGESSMGVILHFTNGGQNWDKKTFPGLPNFSSGFDAVTGVGNTVYVGGDNVSIYHSIDDGMSWTMDNSQAIDGPYALAIYGFDVWASGGQAQVAHTATASPDWTAVVGPKEGGTLYGALANVNGLYVTGTNGLYFTSDGGQSWTLQDPTPELDAFWSSSPTDIFAVGDHGTIYHSSDGKTWQSQYYDGNIYLRAVWGSDPLNVWAVGENDNGPNEGLSIILHTTDGGKAWQVEAMPAHPGMWGIWGSGPDDIYAIADDPADQWTGFLLHRK
jgi:photosystem II stability/assembly factor-like uncharacterized protein